MNFDDLLKTLHQDYLLALPKKILLIGEQAKAGDASELRESFHKLKGTGRTYGMPEVSELAAVVEQVCLNYPKHAVTAAGQALDILRDIHAARSQARAHALESDARFSSIQKLLQN